MPASPHHRRWFQFRLRTLLVFMTLAAFPLAWLHQEKIQRQREQEVADWVDQLSGHTLFHNHDRFQYNKNRGKIDRYLDAQFGYLVKVVELYETSVADLTPLARLERLQYLSIAKTGVKDISPLSKMEHLNFLNLINTRVGDLSPLAGAEKLDILLAENTRVDDLTPLR